MLTFELPPNYVGKVHWHPADTVYVVRRGQFTVDGEGTYEVGDIRWVKAGTVYGPEGAGPEGCEVMLIAAGSFPLPTFDPTVDPPLTTADRAVARSGARERRRRARMPGRPRAGDG